MAFSSYCQCDTPDCLRQSEAFRPDGGWQGRRLPTNIKAGGRLMTVYVSGRSISGMLLQRLAERL